MISECIFFFECKPRPEPEPGAALAGLGSELGLGIYQARAFESQAKATASRPSRAVTSLVVTGCPAQAPAVMAVVHPVKVRSSEKGHAAVWNHAEAMTIEELQKLMAWSETMCPDDMLTMPIEDLETLKFHAEHALMRAFISSVFTLWTRCSFAS